MLSILGIVAIIVIAIQVYKSASGTGRNVAAWAGPAVCVGLAVQFVFPFLIGILVAVYLMVTGTLQGNLQARLFGLMTVIEVAGVVISIVGMFLVARHVSRVNDDLLAAAPPPPPTFNQYP